MAKVNLYNLEGKVVGDYELTDSIYDIEPNEVAVYQVVKAQLANKRQGTSKVKDRSEVRGGGKKPWRQKRTGRARHGSTRSPIWVGGGVTFGPTPRSYNLSINKKVKRLALKSVLSAKAKAEKVFVIDSVELDAPKTKVLKDLFTNLDLVQNALVVIDSTDENAKLSLRNLSNVNYAYYNTINTYDILNHDALIMTQAAAEKIEEVYA